MSKRNTRKWVMVGCGGCGFFLLVLICLAAVILPMVNKFKQDVQGYDRAHRNDQFLDSDDGPAALPATTTAPPARTADTNAAVAALEKLGAKIKRNGQGEIVNVSLFDTPFTDAGLVHLKGLTSLQELSLAKTQVTDAGLVHLKGLTNLKGLVLIETPVTDAGLEHLKGTNLEGLLLLGTQVTDAGVAELQKALPNCEIHR